MFRFLTRSQRPRPAARRRQPRLSVERLEARDCPAAPQISNFAVTPIFGRTVVLSGHVTDENPSMALVTFSGVATGSVHPDANGDFTCQTDASALGTVNAVARDDEGLDSNTAQAVIESVAPFITGFCAIQQYGRICTFQGWVDDESPEGLVVRFGGLPSLEGKTATVGANGFFTLTIELQVGERGTASAQVTDWWGLDSNIAAAIVDPV